MAKIVSSDLAPSGEVHYSLGTAAPFTLGGKSDGYESDDRQVLADAAAHPWLQVEYDEAEAPVAVFRDSSVAPEDDVLSAKYRDADVTAENAEVEEVQPVAIEAGLDQSEEVVEGGVAQTLAADPAADSPKATKKAAKSAAKENN